MFAVFDSLLLQISHNLIWIIYLLLFCVSLSSKFPLINQHDQYMNIEYE